MPTSDDFAAAVEIIADKLYFVCLKRLEQASKSAIAAANLCYCIDNELIYEPFCDDFGPLNLGQTYRFCQKTHRLLQIAQKQGKKLFYLTVGSEKLKANAAVLVGAFQIIFLDRNSREAYDAVRHFEPFISFRDASCLPPTFSLTVSHCLQGLQKAREVGFIDWKSETSSFNVDEYEAFERVEGGDLNWIVPKKLVAFAGPSARRTAVYGYRALVPEDYVPYFKAKSVSTVVRLNNKVYDSRRFTTPGIKHYELFFPDGSCPHLDIVWTFLDICEKEKGAIAVHCKAGLGRTGVLICSYMMKKYGFTAEEALGYIRVCRPGSVIGPQQNFIKHIQDIICSERNPISKPPMKPPQQVSAAEKPSRRTPGKQLSNGLHDRKTAWSLPTTMHGKDTVLFLERKIQELKLAQGARPSVSPGAGYEHALRQSMIDNPASVGYGLVPTVSRNGKQEGYLRGMAGASGSTNMGGRSITAHYSERQSPQRRVTKSASGMHSLDAPTSMINRRIHTAGDGVANVRGLAANGQPRKAGVIRSSIRRTQSTGRASVTMRSPLTPYQKMPADDQGQLGTRLQLHKKVSPQF